jgi:hypothetical protein
MTLLLSVVRSPTHGKYAEPTRLAERYVDLAPPEAWRGTHFPRKAHARSLSRERVRSMKLRMGRCLCDRPIPLVRVTEGGEDQGVSRPTPEASWSLDVCPRQRVAGRPNQVHYVCTANGGSRSMGCHGERDRQMRKPTPWLLQNCATARRDRTGPEWGGTRDKDALRNIPSLRCDVETARWESHT